MEVLIYTDGGSRGNPGKSGFGVAIFDAAGNTIYQYSEFMGISTNNEAEYTALIHGLNWLLNNFSPLHLTSATFKADSEFMVRQINGLYKVKSPNIIPLFTRAKAIIDQIPINIRFLHIPRIQNQIADQLANQAMDRGQ